MTKWIENYFPKTYVRKADKLLVVLSGSSIDIVNKEYDKKIIEQLIIGIYNSKYLIKTQNKLKLFSYNFYMNDILIDYSRLTPLYNARLDPLLS